MVAAEQNMSPEQFAYRMYFRRSRVVSLLPLALLITSFFYCLPLGRFSLGRFDSDFRVFDFAIVLCYLYYLSSAPVMKEINYLLQSRRWFLFWLKWLAVAVVFSILIAVVYGGTGFLLPTLIRVYRFVSYLLVPFVVFAVVRNKSDFLFFFKLYFWLTAAVGVVAFLQGLGLLPNFWPEVWQSMYSENKAPVASLSPHHKHIGVIMMVGVCLGVGYLLMARSLFLKVFIGILCLVMFTVPLFAGTRTYLLGFVAIIPAILLVGKGRSVIPILVMVVASALYLQYSGNEIKTRVEQKIDERIVSRFEKLGYEGLYRERTLIYLDILRAIIENPYLLVTGSGYQNLHHFVGANGAHNNFLQVLVELGVVGFLVFIGFLGSLWTDLRKVDHLFRDYSIRTVAQYAWVAFCGTIMTMFVGETFWGQAAMFTLAGQLSFIFALAVSPLYWIGRYNGLFKLASSAESVPEKTLP